MSKWPGEEVKDYLFTSYIQVIEELLETYTMDDIIAEAEDDILHFTQPPRINPLIFDEALWMNMCRFLHVDDECRAYLKAHSSRACSNGLTIVSARIEAALKDDLMQNLAYEATSFRNLLAAAQGDTNHKSSWFISASSKN